MEARYDNCIFSGNGLDWEGRWSICFFAHDKKKRGWGKAHGHKNIRNEVKHEVIENKLSEN